MQIPQVHAAFFHVEITIGKVIFTHTKTDNFGNNFRLRSGVPNSQRLWNLAYMGLVTPPFSAWAPAGFFPGVGKLGSPGTTKVLHGGVQSGGDLGDLPP